MNADGKACCGELDVSVIFVSLYVIYYWLCEFVFLGFLTVFKIVYLFALFSLMFVIIFGTVLRDERLLQLCFTFFMVTFCGIVYVVRYLHSLLLWMWFEVLW